MIQKLVKYRIFGNIKQPGGCANTSLGPNLNGSHEDRVMATKPLPSQEYLRQLLIYDPQSGTLTWRRRTVDMFDNSSRVAKQTCAAWNRRFAGKEAFTYRHSSGYKTGTIENASYRSHRVIWKIVYGEDPEMIDHINGDRADNRLSNLRSVSSQENARNMGMKSSNKSGRTGVFHLKEQSVWIASIRVYGRSVALGRYRTKEDAVMARSNAERSLGFHENHGLRR